MYQSKEAGEGFHTTGYIFKVEEIYRIIVGSSNMTLNALTRNKEWNTKIVSTDQGEYANDLMDEFGALWHSKAAKKYEDFIEQYTVNYEIAKKQKEIAKQAEIPSIAQYRLEPNSMQVAFVSNLNKLRKIGRAHV